MNTTNTTTDHVGRVVVQDVDPDVSVGGLTAKLAALGRQECSPQLAAVGKMIELRRREKELSAEVLARQARVPEASLSDLERGLRRPNTRDVIVLVARVIDLPGEKLLAAAGLGAAADPHLSSAALQCAARARPPERLSPPENAALTAFMEALGVK